MACYQGRDWETVLYLELLGVPATAVLYSDITVRYRKAGEESFTARTLVADDWINLGSGFYVLKWDGTLLDTLGKFFFTATSTEFDNFLLDEWDIDPVPYPLTVAPDLCVVSGNLRDIGGTPGKTNAIGVRLVQFPAEAGAAIVTSDLVRTHPDHEGDFSFTVLRGKTVIVEIERTAIRHQVEIPDQGTAALLDLLPTLPG